MPKQGIKNEENINFDFPKRSYDSKTHFCVHSIVNCIEAVFKKNGNESMNIFYLVLKFHLEK